METTELLNPTSSHICSPRLISTVAEQEIYEMNVSAKRAERKPRYDLIEPAFLDALGKTLQDGASRYGEHNWKAAIDDYDFAKDTFNHLIEHLYKFRNGDRSEDHIGHASANLMFLNWFTEQNPEWFNGALG